MLILEGADCVGKTMLAHKLLKREEFKGYKYGHLSRLPDTFDFGGGYLRLIDRMTIQDRFHMSEIAYCAARGDDTKLTMARYGVIDSFIKAVGGMTVIITASDKLIRSRFMEEREMYDLDLVLRVNHIFLSIARSELLSYDLHLHVGDELPLSTNVDTIVADYAQRQQLLTQMLKEASCDN